MTSLKASLVEMQQVYLKAFSTSWWSWWSKPEREGVQNDPSPNWPQL